MQRLFYVRLVAGCVILAALFVQVGVSEAAQALSEAKAPLVVLAVVLNIPILALAAGRSAILLHHQGYRSPPDVLLSAATLGFAAGSLTPAAAGELLRVQALNKYAGVPIRASLTLVLFERLVSFYLLCLTAGVTASVLFLPWQRAAPIATLLVAASILPAYASRALALLPLSKDRQVGANARARRFLRRTAAEIEGITKAGPSLPLASGLTVAIFALVALQFYLLAESIGAEITVLVACFGFSFSQIAGIVSMLPIGVADGSLTAVLAEFGVSAHAAIAIALLVRVAISLPLLIAALVTHVYLSVRGVELQSTPPSQWEARS